MAVYTFREFRRSDLPMAARWLRARAVRRWWGNPVRELALLAADRADPRMRQWIVSVRKRPFAYVQAYAADAWPQAHLRDSQRGRRFSTRSSVNGICAGGVMAARFCACSPPG
jgi:hypothetical protein